MSLYTANGESSTSASQIFSDLGAQLTDTVSYTHIAHHSPGCNGDSVGWN
nr:hypothetical protein [Streptococcus oralis]MBS9402007.1 hypothetical protein [Streptococcus oralis]